MQDKRTKPRDLAMGFSREEKWGEPQTDRQKNCSGQQVWRANILEQNRAAKSCRKTAEGHRGTEGQNHRKLGKCF